MLKKHDQKKGEKRKKRGVAMSKKKDKSRERTNALRSRPYPSIHPFIH